MAVGKGTPGGLSKDFEGAKEAAKQSLSKSSEVTGVFAGSRNRKYVGGEAQRGKVRQGSPHIGPGGYIGACGFYPEGNGKPEAALS